MSLASVPLPVFVGKNNCNTTDGFPYTYQIYKGSEEFNKGTFLETYYDALNEAIEHALELI